jgi:hypothetical protein
MKKKSNIDPPNPLLHWFLKHAYTSMKCAHNIIASNLCISREVKRLYLDEYASTVIALPPDSLLYSKSTKKIIPGFPSKKTTTNTTANESSTSGN